MEKLKFRCPACRKLYLVAVGKLAPAINHFECGACSCLFHINADHRKDGWALAVRDMDQAQQPIKAAAHNGFVGPEFNEQCPKCGALNQKSASECYSCQVLLARVRSLPLDTSLRATPRLVHLWEQAFSHYENEAYHEIFIEECAKAKALAYARNRYEVILASAGPDVVAKKQLRRVLDLEYRAQKTAKDWMPAINHLFSILIRELFWLANFFKILIFGK